MTYDEKEQAFQRLTPAERTGKEPPAKHRFPKGFHRGQELFGQHTSRLSETGYREFIAKHGLILVEGFNDVINLDRLGISALGTISNRMPESQCDKVAGWATEIASCRVNLMFDCDPPGVEGAKEALWNFSERRIDVWLVWSLAMHDGAYVEQQPESLGEPM